MKCNYIEIGNRIRMIRQSGNYTQAAFAEMLYVSREQIARIESGARNPSLELLIGIADIGNVSLDYLVRGQDFSKTAKLELHNIIELLSNLEKKL